MDHKLVGADEVPEGDYAGGSRLIHRPPYLDLHRSRVTTWWLEDGRKLYDTKHAVI